VTQRVVFRPLLLSAPASSVGGQAALIATLGLAIFLREAMRLAGGSRDRWLEPVFTLSHTLVHSGGFEATISSGQLIILAIAATVVGALGLLITGSRFGRRYRACCDDIDMAALAGVDVDRIVGGAFLLGAASAGMAGAMMTLHYGTVSAYMGTLIGFKALSAAVIGGLGSLGGAVLGGITVAAFETLWAAYFSGHYRDVAAFGLLAVFLVLRPHGLLGR
jgi:branched-chain amino acid transport system permease protein